MRPLTIGPLYISAFLVLLSWEIANADIAAAGFTVNK